MPCLLPSNKTTATFSLTTNRVAHTSPFAWPNLRQIAERIFPTSKRKVCILPTKDMTQMQTICLSVNAYQNPSKQLCALTSRSPWTAGAHDIPERVMLRLESEEGDKLGFEPVGTLRACFLCFWRVTIRTCDSGLPHRFPRGFYSTLHV